MLPYQQTFCPLLSLASIKKEEPLIQAGLTPKPIELDMVRCQGPSCAWFLTMGNDDGKPLGGRCALGVLPIVLQQMSPSEVSPEEVTN